MASHVVHVVRQGESLSSLAAWNGFSSWQDLYNHPSNAELKRKRPNPNILAPGDEVVIPDRERRTKSVSINVGQTHKFAVKLAKVKLRVAIVDSSGRAEEGKRFLANVGEREIKGTTTSGGLVEVEVPATQSTARLRVWLEDDGEDALPTIDRDLAIGHIDPIDTVSGVQGRLSNLGYRCPVSNEIAVDLDDPTLVAVRSFRAKNSLPEVVRPKSKNVQGDEHDAKGNESIESASDSNAQPQTSDGLAAEEIARYVELLIDDAFRQKLRAAYESSGA